VGPRAVLDTVAKRKILCSCWQSKLGHPATPSHYIDWAALTPVL